MFDCLITFRSVMPAQRAEERLQSESIGCQVRRTPKWMEEQGCGYCLRLWTGDATPGVELLRRERVPMRKIYAQREDGQLEELTL